MSGIWGGQGGAGHYCFCESSPSPALLLPIILHHIPQWVSWLLKSLPWLPTPGNIKSKILGMAFKTYPPFHLTTLPLTLDTPFYDIASSFLNAQTCFYISVPLYMLFLLPRVFCHYCNSQWLYAKCFLCFIAVHSYINPIVSITIISI